MKSLSLSPALFTLTVLTAALVSFCPYGVTGALGEEPPVPNNSDDAHIDILSGFERTSNVRNELLNSQKMEIVKERWSLTVETTGSGAIIASGKFGELEINSGELFELHLAGKERTDVLVSSAESWGDVRLRRDGDLLQLWFSKHDDCKELTVALEGEIDDKGISWSLEVINGSSVYSVEDASYPFPRISGAPLNLFLPDRSGRVITDADSKSIRERYEYPGHVASMQYFAFWGKSNGVYLGIHDPDACLKHFDVKVDSLWGQIDAVFPAIGAGSVANSFALPGKARWEAFSGDWYDATAIYKDFVLKHAKWLPAEGRPDTSRKFKEIAYWICDYIPNSPEQGDAKPMTLGAASERYGKGYWIDAAIALKKRLGVPVGYQVYNWHEIPFNINYPHFLPAKQEFIDGVKRLKEAGIYVFPYINAVSWEMDDADEGFEENFENVGRKGAAIKKDGSPYFVPYPQVKKSGMDTRLAPICPTFPRWGQIIEETARGLEEAADIDGIYFDQIAAVPPVACRNPEHDHKPGGGSYWIEGYNRIMTKVRANKPRDAFYYSESNAEPYMKSFDGLLTWIWTKGDEVPAFPAVYAGRVQMIGRYTDGATREDDDYFRYHLAEELVFGQQIGWLNANVVYNEDRMAFLEKIVQTRHRYSDLFNDGYVLRPPVVLSNLPPVESSGISMRQVIAGAWKKNGGTQCVVFAVNVSKKPAKAALRLFPEEYGGPDSNLPNALELDLEPLEVRVIELPEKNPQ